MKRKILLLLFSTLLLSSCLGETSSNDESSRQGSTSMDISSNDPTSDDLPSSSTINSTSSADIPTSDSSATSDTSLPDSPWNAEVSDAMIKILGEHLPYLEDFGDSYLYTTGTIYQSSIPYINIYFKNGRNWVSQYSALAARSGYVYDTTEADYETGDMWTYYYKEIEDDSYIELKFSFYKSEMDYYFDMYAYIEGTIPGEIPIPTSHDYAVLPSHFGTKSYPETVTALEISHVSNGSVIKLAYKYIMNQATTVQFKKSTGVLYNSEAIANLKYLYLENLDYTERITVEMGTSLSSMRVVTSFNRVYDIQGATYFRIKANDTGVVRMDSIKVILK